MTSNLEFRRKYFVDYLISGGGIIILLLFVGKLYYLNEINLTLSYDESYYWDWSRKLDFGYYSKPPMVAWLIYLSTKIFGNTENAIRLPALLSMTFFTSISYVLVCKYLGFSLARLVLATVSFTPIFFIYSFVMTIDPPLVFFWSLSFYYFVSFVYSPSLLFSILLGITIGLGLLTKQTMFIFYLLTLLYFFVFERSQLRSKYFLIILILPLFILSPNIFWNIKNNLIMFQHTVEHFTRSTPDIKYLLTFYFGLFILYGPLFVVLLFAYGIKFLNVIINKVKASDFTFYKSNPKIGFIFYSFYFSFIPLLVFLPISLFKKFNLNWIMPFFITSFYWVIPFCFQHSVHRLLIYLNLFIILLLAFLIIFLVRNPDAIEIKGSKPVKLALSKFIGWRELANAVNKYRENNIPIITNHREVASSLAFYLKDHPEICVLREKNQVTNQYHLWYDCNTLVNKEVIYVQKGQGQPGFMRDIRMLDEVKIELNGRSKIYQIWRGTFTGLK